MDSIQNLLSNIDWATISIIVAHVIALAATITALTPTPKDDTFLAGVIKVLNLLGMNVGNAKNEKK